MPLISLWLDTLVLRTMNQGQAHPQRTWFVLDELASLQRLEEQLQISEKMASIGLLAAGVAHEVNTPLTGISSYTQMLLERADPDDPGTKLLEKIGQAPSTFWHSMSMRRVVIGHGWPRPESLEKAHTWETPIPCSLSPDATPIRPA